MDSKVYKKTSSGFSLMEVTIALAIWMILSLSVLLIWQHTTSRAEALLARQNALENARSSMDGLVMNIQMARSINLQVGHDYTLQRIGLTQINPEGRYHEYEFTFNANAGSTDASFRRLMFGANNEFASGIAMVRIEPIGGRHMHITVTTACEYPIVLEGSVDIRYKTLVVTGQHG